MVLMAMRPGCSNMLESQSTLLCLIFVFYLHLSVTDTQEIREARTESGSRVIVDLDIRKIQSHLFRRNDQDLAPQRRHKQHPPVQLIEYPGPHHIRDPDGLGPQRPNGQTPRQLDLGPHRPGGQVPPDARLTPLGILSVRELGQRLSNRIRRDIDTGPHRPGLRHPIPDPLGLRQSPPVDSDSLWKISRRTSGDVGQRVQVFSQDDWRSNIDFGPQRPNGQFPPSVDLGPQGQHPPEEDDSMNSNGFNGDRKRVRRDVDVGPQRPGGQIPQNAEIFSVLGETDVQDNSRDNDIEVSPYTKIVRNDAFDLSEEDGNGIYFRIPHDLGPHRPMVCLNPNGLPSPPDDLGPQRTSAQHPTENVRVVLSDPIPVDLGPHRPSGATDPNGVPSTPSDLGPQRPSGQHPPSKSTSQKLASHSRPSDLGLHRPTGAREASGLPSPPSDLGPQRPFGQHPPEDEAQRVFRHSPPSDLGTHRLRGSKDPNGVPSVPSDLGPQRPFGQHSPSDSAAHRIARDSRSDLGPQRPGGQHPLTESVSQRLVLRSPPGDLGPRRPSGSTDPNGIPPLPSDLGPQRPSGQQPPSAEDLGPQRPSGQHPPSAEDLGPQRPFGQHPPSAEDLGPQRPSGQHPPSAEDLGPQRPFGQHPPSAEDLGPQRPSGQHPPESAQKISSADPLDGAAQTILVYYSPPSDVGPSGATDPNVIPSPFSDMDHQTPSGQQPHKVDASRVTVLHAPSVDLGPQRPSGDVDPNGPPPLSSDLGPQRPSGQHPPKDSPLRIESTNPVMPIDLGPRRPAGPTDPNIKPGLENDQERSPYYVYWNVPTFMCHKHGYKFRNLSGEFGIVQNPNDTFRGPRVTILYDPGLFPAVVQDEKGQKFLRNGGVPQEGDLQNHLAALEDSIEEQVPKDFDGLGVIDFEAWRPVWAQNWGTLNIYRTVSMDLEKRRDPGATRRALEIRAKARFEAAARVYFEATMQLAQQLRPRGRWGFYGFPHCFNQVPSRPADYTCAPQHQLQNDKIDWLWKASTALYPSVYLTKANKSAHDESAFVSGRLTEAQRVAKGVPVYAYVWYRYHDSGAFLTEDDLSNSLLVPRRLNLAGTILWGSSSDLNSREKCARFSQVLRESIGPAVVRTTGRRTKKDSPTVIFAT